MFGLEKAQGDLTHVYKYLIRWSNAGETRFLLAVARGRPKGSGHKLKERKLHLNIERNSSVVTTTEHWHRLTKEVVESPSLQIFKTQLVMVLGNLQYLTLL